MRTLPDGHDRAHLTKALQYVRDWRGAVDAGAHRGLWTRVLLQRFEDVVAVEPHPPHVEALQQLESVRVVAAALGETAGEAALVPGPRNDGQWHLTEGRGVRVVALDELTDLPPYVDFLKLDVEGYELFVLRGAARTIKRCRPVILLEENGLCARYGVEPGAAGWWLEDRGYRRVARINKDEVYVSWW